MNSQVGSMMILIPPTRIRLYPCIAAPPRADPSAIARRWRVPGGTIRYNTGHESRSLIPDSPKRPVSGDEEGTMNSHGRQSRGPVRLAPILLRADILLCAGILLVTGGSSDEIEAAIADFRLVYVEIADSNRNVWSVDLLAGTSTQVTSGRPDPSAPAVSSRFIAWQDVTGDFDRDIRVRDLALGGDYTITGPGPQITPAASGSRVVYLDLAANGAVKVYDAETRVTSTVFGGPAAEPDIDGINVTYARSGPSDTDIAVSDVSGPELALLTLDGFQGS